VKKKGLSTRFDVAVDEISEVDSILQQTTHKFILLREAERQLIPEMSAEPSVHINQTWSIPERNYPWFPYFMMYLTSK
jgi:hypothetical protein